MVVLPDRLIDGEDELAERFESRGVAEIDLELRIERLLIPVLPRATGRRAGDHRTDGLQGLDVHLGSVFAAVVAVEDERPGMVVQSVHECREDKLCGMGGIHGDTDDLSGIEVEDGGDIHESPLKREISEVGRPDMILVQRLCDHQQIWINHLDILGFLPLPASPPVCLDAEEIHHSLHRLSVHLEMDSEAARAV